MGSKAVQTEPLMAFLGCHLLVAFATQLQMLDNIQHDKSIAFDILEM